MKQYTKVIVDIQAPSGAGSIDGVMDSLIDSNLSIWVKSTIVILILQNQVKNMNRKEILEKCN